MSRYILKNKFSNGMKKTYYLAIFGLILGTLFSLNTALAQSSDDSKPGFWGSIFGPKKEKLDEQKIRLDERKEKFASTTAKIEELRKERESKMASTSAKIEDRIKDRQIKMASTTLKLQERIGNKASSTEAKRLRLEDKFKSVQSKQIGKINDRLADAIERIRNIDTRLKAHILKLKARNVDTTKADALLVDAEAKLKLAEDKVTALNTSLQAILTENISTTTKNTIKTKTMEANSYVKDAHGAYINVVKNLKPGQYGNGSGSGTTTKSTATSTTATTTNSTSTQTNL